MDKSSIQIDRKFFRVVLALSVWATYVIHMDKPPSPSERIIAALANSERSKAWLARTTQIPVPTLDRKLRGTGDDFTLAQIHSISTALSVSVLSLVSDETAVAS